MDNKLKFDFVELQVSSLRPVKLLFLHVFENKKDVSDIYNLVCFLAKTEAFRNSSSFEQSQDGKRLACTLKGFRTLLEFNFYKDDIKI